MTFTQMISYFSEKFANLRFNFNVFETNILNLIIVIGVLIYYGKPLLFFLMLLINQ